MFTCVIQADVQIELTILQGDGEYLIRAPIGYDGDDDKVYSLFVALSPLPGYADIPGYELCFSIIEAKSDQSFLRDFWDGLETKRILSDARQRGLVSNLLMVAIQRLVDEAAPGLVHMTTHTPDLPRGALQKFYRIAAMFERLGYESGRADSWHGRYIWMMQRPV